ncbi:unnamed protein product [Rotaria sordida]|uniref:Uncharacterized protein n=1 Tax=Rotaria sordida TaxID=392033 RepID=A0A814CG11_9BILA|nr:unnamed protein product [Rotaria sordida]
MIYTQKIINEIRTSLPDTTETFDQIPTKQEVKHAIIDTCEIQAFKKVLNGLLIFQYIFVDYYLQSKARKNKIKKYISSS